MSENVSSGLKAVVISMGKGVGEHICKGDTLELLDIM